MRAGALREEQSFWRIAGLAPIDVYEQYVVKLTVALSPKRMMVVGNTHGPRPR
ncbi:MAG: hypothetical protein Q8K32_07050 [Archangium sp.]|nr:hypothetical protein [Archangium sp.]